MKTSIAVICLTFITFTAFGFEILNRKDVLLHKSGQQMNCDIATSDFEIKKALSEMNIAIEKIERIEIVSCQLKNIVGDLNSASTKISIFTTR